MIDLERIKAAPEFSRLRRAVLTTLMIWLMAAVVVSYALSYMRDNEDRLSDAEKILNGAIVLKSYPKHGAVSAMEPLTAVSAIIDKAGVHDRIAQLASSAAGLVVQANRLYPAEFEDLVEGIRENGLVIKTAEVRVLSSNKDGRLLNVTITIEGDRE